MLLQYFVVLFYSLHDQVTYFVTTTQENLSKSGTRLLRVIGNRHKDEVERIIQNLSHDAIDNCFAVSIGGYEHRPPDRCKHDPALFKHTADGIAQLKPAVGEVGEAWHEWLMRKEHLLITALVKNAQGDVVGALGGVYSVAHIFSSANRLLLIGLVYLVVNVIIFGVIFYFRMVRYLFRPLDRLAVTAENYTHDQNVWMHDEQIGELSQLSSSIRSMLDRIEADNTRLRRTISELADANRQLEQHKDTMVRSEKLASVGRLSAGLAHEIGNPLGIVQGYLDLLSDSNIAGDDRKLFVARATKELERITQLVRQLLDYSRSEDISQQQINVHGLISKVIQFARLEKRLKGCEMHFEAGAQSDLVLASEDGMRQILLNCLLNSGDATLLNKGARLITISTENISNTKRDELIITIRDNGAGINASDVPNVFDPFFTTKDVGEGTGLGLFVCHQYVTAYGGKIQLKQVEEGGTEVTIAFPTVADIRDTDDLTQNDAE